MDDTSVQTPEAHVLTSRKALSGLARLAAALSMAGVGLVAGPLSHRASADVTYCRQCPSSHFPGSSDASTRLGGWTSPQNTSN